MKPPNGINKTNLKLPLMMKEKKLKKVRNLYFDPWKQKKLHVLYKVFFKQKNGFSFKLKTNVSTKVAKLNIFSNGKDSMTMKK